MYSSDGGADDVLDIAPGADAVEVQAGVDPLPGRLVTGETGAAPEEISRPCAGSALSIALTEPASVASLDRPW